MKKAPLNLDLIVADSQYVKTRSLKEITSMNISSTTDGSFDPEGLYSSEIFGPVGSEKRMNTFAYIDLKIPILSPLIYKTLVEMRSLYVDIMAGKEYVKLVKVKDEYDFVSATVMDGSTGYQFFVENIDKLKLLDRGSPKRKVGLEVLKKFKGRYFVDKLLVLPVGYREYEVTKDGTPTDPEINSMYRSVLGLTNIVDTSQVKNNIESMDGIRNSIQQKVVSIYDYIMDFLDGKAGFIQGKFARRNIAYTSRNVITALSVEKQTLRDKNTPGPNDTVVGIQQAAVNTLPILSSKLTGTVLMNIFIENSNDAYLIDPNTLHRTHKQVKPKTVQKWTTRDGLSKVVDSLIQEAIRDKPIMIEDMYLALIYSKDDVFKIVYDINSVPEDIDKSYITPITYGELFYIVIASYIRNYHTLVTRYPVLSEGGVYPSKTFLISTLPFVTKYSLDDLWNKTDNVFPCFPIRGERYYNSTSPSPTHLGRLGGDHDGDTVSTQTVLSKEANEELDKLLKSKKYYVNTTGDTNYSAAVDVAEYCLSYLIG